MAYTLASLGVAIAKLKSLTSQYDLDIKLPGLIVIGSQSVGKSSVLQAIVGLKEPFLPSGDGVVTRVPLQLQLRGVPDAVEAYVTFDHASGKHFSLLEAKEEILKFTSSKCPGKDVRDEPLSMTIHKKGLVDLMLIDLPGMTEIPVDA